MIGWIAGLLALDMPAAHTPMLTHTTPRTVFVHLFEWTWPDIARECENYLGPQGFAAVQVSPPNEHALIQQSDGNYPWWQRYQPVSYRIDQSRSGTRSEFEDMVTRCRKVGVDIYVDTVINHMTGGNGTGFDGTYFYGSNNSPYTKYNYPGIYADHDFSRCRHNITTYHDAWQVQTCELVGLADLDTGSEYVRTTIANYLIELVQIGVRGFRIDAVKHINPIDVEAIIARVNAAVEPNPYYFLEIIDHGGEAVHASDYFYVGDGQADITEFTYQDKLSKKFLNATYPGGHEKIAELRTFGEAWGLLPSDKAVVFTNNHDSQRGHGGSGAYISYQHSSLNDLAHVFMLAWPMAIRRSCRATPSIPAPLPVRMLAHLPTPTVIPHQSILYTATIPTVSTRRQGAGGYANIAGDRSATWWPSVTTPTLPGRSTTGGITAIIRSLLAAVTWVLW